MKNIESLTECENAFVSKYNFVRDGGKVRRYHTRHLNKPETVAEHSWGVATIVDLLYGGAAPVHVLRAALYHDIAEQTFGDIPSPAKSMFATPRFREAEDHTMRTHGLLVKLTEWERRVLKLADMLDGMAFCSEERERGNVGIVDVYKRYRQYVHERLLQMACDAQFITETEHSLVTEQAARIIGCITGKMEAIHGNG